MADQHDTEARGVTDHREQLRALADALPLDGAATVPVSWLRELLAGTEGPGLGPDAPAPDFTVAQVAARFGRAASIVRGWVAAGQLTGAYHFRGRELRIPAAAVLAFEAQQRGLLPIGNTATPRQKPRSRRREPDLSGWRKLAS